MKMLYNDLRDLFRLGIFSRRTWRFVFQYLWRGWSDKDTWSMDCYVARKAQPVFHRFVELEQLFCGSPQDPAILEAQKAIDDFVSGDWQPEVFQEKWSNRLAGFWW